MVEFWLHQRFTLEQNDRDCLVLVDRREHDLVLLYWCCLALLLYQKTIPIEKFVLVNHHRTIPCFGKHTLGQYCLPCRRCYKRSNLVEPLRSYHLRRLLLWFQCPWLLPTVPQVHCLLQMERTRLVERKMGQMALSWWHEVHRCKRWEQRRYVQRNVKRLIKIRFRVFWLLQT